MGWVLWDQGGSDFWGTVLYSVYKVSVNCADMAKKNGGIMCYMMR